MRRIGWLCLSAVVPGLLGGCAGGVSDSPSTSPWEADVRALASSPVAVVQEVVQDGVIEEIEYREVQDTYLKCINDLGFTASTWMDENGVESYQADGELTDELKSATRTCGETTGLDALEGLYLQIKTNPDRVDFNELIAQCLREFKVVDESYTGEQYTQDLKAGSRPGVDPGSSELLRCENDPLAAVGGP